MYSLCIRELCHEQWMTACLHAASPDMLARCESNAEQRAAQRPAGQSGTQVHANPLCLQDHVRPSTPCVASSRTMRKSSTLTLRLCMMRAPVK